MKRLCTIVAILLIGALCLTACGGGDENLTAIGTTAPDLPAVEIGSTVIRPPTRSANKQYSARRCTLSLIELWEAADAVAWVSIGNWLSETEHGSYYDATVRECYKGDLPASIVLEQAGASTKTYTDFPLFTYGNEFLIFLHKWDEEAISVVGATDGTVIPSKPPSIKYDTGPELEWETEEDGVMPIEDDDIWVELPSIGPTIVTREELDPELSPETEPELPYENCYQILQNVALLDAAVGMDGKLYLWDRYYLVDPYLGLTSSVGRIEEEIESDLLQILEARDAYSYRLFDNRIFYRFTDLLECMQNPPPETSET